MEKLVCKSFDCGDEPIVDGYCGFCFAIMESEGIDYEAIST